MKTGRIKIDDNEIQIQSSQCIFCQNIVQIILIKTGRFCFSSKGEANNFNNNIANTNTQSVKYKDTLLGNKESQPNPNHANGVLKNATIAVLLKYFRNLGRLLEIPLVNCKVELKLKWAKFCVLSAGDNDNLNDNDIDNQSNNIVVIIKDAQLCSCSSPSAKNNQKLSNLFSIEFKKSV